MTHRGAGHSVFAFHPSTVTAVGAVEIPEESGRTHLLATLAAEVIVYPRRQYG